MPRLGGGLALCVAHDGLRPFRRGDLTASDTSSQDIEGGVVVLIELGAAAGTDVNELGSGFNGALESARVVNHGRLGGVSLLEGGSSCESDAAEKVGLRREIPLTAGGLDSLRLFAVIRPRVLGEVPEVKTLDDDRGIGGHLQGEEPVDLPPRQEHVLALIRLPFVQMAVLVLPLLKGGERAAP